LICLLKSFYTYSGHLTVKSMLKKSLWFLINGYATADLIKKAELHPIINEHVSGSWDMFCKEKLVSKRMKESHRENSWLHIFDRFGLQLWLQRAGRCHHSTKAGHARSSYPVPPWIFAFLTLSTQQFFNPLLHLC